MLGTTTFSTNPTITSFLSTADNSSSIPTTAWVKTYFSTFSSNQILNTIYAGTAYIVTGTAYVSKIQANSSTSVFSICDNLTTGSLSIGSTNASNTMLGTTTFLTHPLINSSLPVSDNSSRIPSTAWVNSFMASYATPQILNNIYAGTAYVVTGTAYLSKIQANSSTSTFTFCDNLTSGSLSIGSLTSSTTILGTTNVSVLNSSTIDSYSSILNIGPTNATTINIGKTNTAVNLTSGIINASFLNISSTTFGNTTNSVLIDTSKKNSSTTQIQIGLTNAEEVYIGNGSQNKNIVIGNATSTTNTIKIGNANSTNVINGTTTINTKAIVDGSPINAGTNIFCVKQYTGSYNSITDALQDPMNITSPSGSSTANVTLGMGIDTTYNCAYINCAMSGYGRPLVLCPRLGNVYVGPIPSGFDTVGQSNTGGTYSNLVVAGNTYPYSPVIPKYSYPITSPTQIGWTQSVNTGFVAAFTTSSKTYACNTTLMPPGLYSIKFFVYVGNGQLGSGQNILTVLQGSNTFKANETLVSSGGVIDPNGGTYGYYLTRTFSQTTFGMDTVVNHNWIINNTNTGGSQYLPYMFLTITVTANSGSGAYVDATFTRIA